MALEKVTNPQAFTTEALKVDLLYVDSTDEHETGDPETWTNKVKIKHKVYTSPDRMKRVELKAVPKVPVRYTTDGSNPRTAGGVYDGPIEISEGTQVVQAVRDGDGIVAEPQTIRIDDEGEVSLSGDALRFETGQRLADWTEDAKVDLDAEEVQQ